MQEPHIDGCTRLEVLEALGREHTVGTDPLKDERAPIGGDEPDPSATLVDLDEVAGAGRDGDPGEGRRQHRSGEERTDRHEGRPPSSQQSHDG